MHMRMAPRTWYCIIASAERATCAPARGPCRHAYLRAHTGYACVQWARAIREMYIAARVRRNLPLHALLHRVVVPARAIRELLIAPAIRERTIWPNAFANEQYGRMEPAVRNNGTTNNATNNSAIFVKTAATLAERRKPNIASPQHATTPQHSTKTGERVAQHAGRHAAAHAQIHIQMEPYIRSAARAQIHNRTPTCTRKCAHARAVELHVVAPAADAVVREELRRVRLRLEGHVPAPPKKEYRITEYIR